MFAAINAFLTSSVSGYFLNKSLRFRSSASAYLNRTPAVSGNTNTWTWSGWVKRGTSGFQAIYNTSLTGNSDLVLGSIYLTSADTLSFFQYNLTTPYTTLITTQVFRDFAAWYHIVVAYDDTQATASNRVKIYVNGSQVTSFSTANYPTASFGGYFNRAQPTYFAKDAEGTPGAYFDGEMAEVNFVDGQALAPTAFGATGANSQWLPKAYAGTYGTNGFYLPFTNTASTSTLVADSSGNANNWTPNNISLTAGSTYDSLTDVPTLTSTTVANYAVLNPLGNINGAQATLSNGNLTATSSGNAWWNSTISIPPTGKFYCEYTPASVTNTPYLGLAAPSGNNSSYISDGRIFINGSLVTTVATYTSGDVIACAYDTAGTVTFYKNNTSVYSGAYAYQTNLFFYGFVSSATVSANFGQQPFTYTPPSGFLPLNTFNIAAGTVTTSGTFTGNLSTDGPFVFLNGTPTAMTINGNAVTFGTQADKLANGFKVRSSSASYNTAGSNTYVATTVAEVLKYENAQPNP